MYGKNENKAITKNTILYRGTSMKLIDATFYERNLNEIITLSTFTSTTSDKSVAVDFSHMGRSPVSVIYTINYSNKSNWIPSTVNISDVSAFKSEDEKLFVPFTFFKITKVDLNLNEMSLNIEMYNVGRKEILEEEIKKGKVIVYNKNENIMEAE